MKKFIITLIILCSSLNLISCGVVDGFKEGVKDGAESSINNDNNNKLDNIDWERCIEETKKEVTNPEYFSYVKDVYINVDNSKEEIVFTAVVNDSTSANISKDYADTLIRRFNLIAALQNGAIKTAGKEYFGEVYDFYSIKIGVSTNSLVRDIDKWHVNERIPKGTFKKLN